MKYFTVTVKIGDEKRTLSINLDRIQHVDVFQDAFFFYFSKDDFLSIGKEESPAGYKVDNATADKILQTLIKYHMINVY